MVKEEIRRALERASGTKNSQLEFPENEDFGDYSTNIALRFKNPKEKAEAIKSKLERDKKLSSYIEKIEVAGAGFINFWLKKEFLMKNLKRINPHKPGKGKTVLVEYSSPNIAKRFGIGHLRSTIIGQALYNLYQSLGYQVIGENHLGDWGTQFGAVLYQISGLKYQDLTIDELEKRYVEFNKKAESDPKLWDEARAWFKRLEEGDPEAKKIWQAVREISLKEFARIYRLLGVRIDNAHGESFYEDKMVKVLDEVRKKGLSKKSRGAEIVEFKSLPPAILVKSDGATTYFTRDLAAIKYRIRSWNPDLLIYEVGADQRLHLNQVFEAAKLLGWAGKKELVHVAHGLIRFKEGKMSTRKGRTIKLEKVLDEAIARARKFNDEEEVAKAVGIGAVKYFDLMHSPTSDIIFDWDKMFVLEGNSGPYLQYTYARTKSVLKKAKGGKVQKAIEPNLEELSLMRSLYQFPEVVEAAAKHYSPNLLCNYLYGLSQKYNTFYNKHKIIGSEEENLRLLLTKAVANVLKNGLSLLGIATPERM